MTRDEVIGRLAAAFGGHKSYNAGFGSYVPDGDDAEGSCTTTFIAGDGYPAIRILTYGEIADALTGGGQ